ncbi:MAG: serine hydrolase [Proteobacteria bacterium]|nr:serine hydrolase [Pseudomonadota bacterium]
MHRLAVSAISFLIAIVSLVAAARPSFADGRYAAIAVDANTGQVLHAEAADEPRYPASLTKMMTLYLVFEALEQGRLKLATPIRISAEAASVSPSKLDLPPGSTIAAGDAIRALITKSANDVAVAFAEHLAGDEVQFADLMTRKARALGMHHTTFRNANGLPDRGQVTTARDIVTLAMRLYDRFPSESRLFALRSFQYGGRSYRNHNTMLDAFAGMDGVKTGYTALSGFNLVASVHRDGKHVLAAVFGGPTASVRNARMRIILTRALLQASTEKSRRPLGVATSVPAPVRVQVRRPSGPPLPSPTRPAAIVSSAEPPLVDAVRPAAKATKPAEPVPQRDASAPHAGWRSSVRLAAPIGDSSVVARLGGAQALARPPSTLQAQAASITPHHARAALPSTGALGGPHGDVHIQIGAFPSQAEARARVEQVRRILPSLSVAGSATPTVAVNGRTLYRARFIGLDRQHAATACIELRRQQIDCLVARAE